MKDAGRSKARSKARRPRRAGERQAPARGGHLPGTALFAGRRGRFAFLSELSRVLATSLDARETLHTLARLLVPALADYCILHLFDEEGRISRTEAVHRDPGRQLLLANLVRRFPALDPAFSLSSQAPGGLAGGTARHIPELTSEHLRVAARSAEHLQLLVELEPVSELRVPLLARGRIQGAVTLTLAAGSRRYGTQDLELAQEVAHRAALACDNARLYEQAQQARAAAEAAKRGAQEAIRRRDETVAQLDSLLASAPIGLSFVDSELRYVRINEVLAAINGVPVAATIGRTVREVLPDMANTLETVYRHILASGEPVVSAEVAGRTAAQPGLERHFLVNLYPIFSLEPGARRGGKPAGVGAAVVEITDRKHLEQELERRIEQLRLADRRKDEFLAMLAHELRNPLAALAHAGQFLMAGEAAPPGAQPMLAVIDRQVRQLARLVDDLLDVSRFTRGSIELRIAPAELAAIVAGAVETIRPLVEERGQQLAVSLGDEPLWLEADGTRLEQVIANLLNNASKFTPPGGHLVLSARRESGQVVLVVRDDGAGIAPELLPRIFDLFVQEDRSLARSHGGLGIGLTLVRSLVERHGGQVEATSAGAGQGTAITVRLPLRQGGRAPELAEAAVALAPPGVARILLVEDNHDAAMALNELLRLWGHEVVVVHDGAAALEQARRREPEVVLLDIGLPGMDGYEVARALRSLPGLRQTRLIALTGYGQEADRQLAREAGFDHHLVKPVKLDELRRLVAAAPPSF